MALLQPRSRIQQLNAWLQSPEDGAGLAIFRIAFGLAMAWDAARYIAKGWAVEIYSHPFLFKYWGFEWLTPLPGPGMLAVYVGMVVAAVLIAAGACYRAAIVYYFLAHTYVFLLSATHFLNHAYLISLVAFLLIWMPANRCLAIDAWRRGSLRELPTPRWCRFTLQAQVAIVYVFGAIAKLNGDWLAGVPVAQWLRNSAGRNPWAAELIASPEMVPLVVWGGIAFDLLIVPALLWRRTRTLAVVASVGFHVSNSILFHIGVFPWFMLGATTLFLEPNWPRRIPGLSELFERWQAPTTPQPQLRLLWAPVCLWLLVQVAMPLRHYLYPGNVMWTEQGQLYSWHMKLRAKSGQVTFRVRDPATGEEWRIFPEHKLGRWHGQRMAGRPELILQYAHHIAATEHARLGHPVEVRADAFASLNYRRPQRLIDPDRDLAQVHDSLLAYDWVLPFEWTPPRRPRARKQRPHKSSIHRGRRSPAHESE